VNRWEGGRRIKTTGITKRTGEKGGSPFIRLSIEEGNGAIARFLGSINGQQEGGEMNVHRVTDQRAEKRP